MVCNDGLLIHLLHRTILIPRCQIGISKVIVVLGFGSIWECIPGGQLDREVMWVGETDGDALDGDDQVAQHARGIECGICLSITRGDVEELTPKEIREIW